MSRARGDKPIITISTVSGSPLILNSGYETGLRRKEVARLERKNFYPEKIETARELLGHSNIGQSGGIGIRTKIGSKTQCAAVMVLN